MSLFYDINPGTYPGLSRHVVIYDDVAILNSSSCEIALEWPIWMCLFAWFCLARQSPLDCKMTWWKPLILLAYLFMATWLRDCMQLHLNCLIKSNRPWYYWLLFVWGWLDRTVKELIIAFKEMPCEYGITDWLLALGFSIGSRNYRVGAQVYCNYVVYMYVVGSLDTCTPIHM